MIKVVDLAQNYTQFSANKPKDTKKVNAETRILPNTLNTRVKQGFQKTSSAFLDYPIKGLQGDINSNFYEFLTMGIVPYLAGSAMFMTVFNCVNKYLDAKGKKVASSVGKKLALGVIFYGVLKNISKNLVTKPVKVLTGVDTEMPYENIVYPLPKEAGEAANIEIQHQQRKVFDSKEFYRKDLLDRSYFDNVARKLGLGSNLNDSISETSPIIQNIVATSGMAKSLSSYAWAGLGVALASQDAWINFFDSITNRSKYLPKENETIIPKLFTKTRIFLKNTIDITKEFCKSTLSSCKELWKGNPANTGYMRHAGKAFILFTIGLTSLLTANTIIRARNLAKNKNINYIDKTKESTVI